MGGPDIMQSSNHGVRGNKKIAYPHAGSNSPLASSSFFSSQNRNMDYVTQSGISERTGISKNDLPKFALKELLDNAIDFIERQEPLSRKENLTLTSIIAPNETCLQFPEVLWVMLSKKYWHQRTF